MGWTEGYASNVEYIAGYYAEQAPDLLTFACLMNGIEPIDTSEPYSYCELGFGRGLTVSLLAAANPHAQFYAADFNPAHVAGAQRLAKRANLSNLTLLENSFGELAVGGVADLPQFDFITMHGIYSWVNRDVKQQIVEFLKRYLKPGGIVYISYNAMPGWSTSSPIQRLLYEHAQLKVDAPGANVRDSVEFASGLAKLKRGIFGNNPALEARLESVRDASPNYLIHEYMHPHWEPLYHADVARQLAEAKLEFAGRADLAANFYRLFVPEEAAKQIEAIADEPFRETLKDFMMNTTFRKDIFVKGARRIGQSAVSSWLERFYIAPLAHPKVAVLDFKTSHGTVNGRKELFGPLLAELDSGPKRLSDLVGLPDLETTTGVIEATALLAGSQQAAVYQTRTCSPDASRRLNRELAKEAEHTDQLNGGLASPLTGAAVPAGMFELLVYDGLTSGVASDARLLSEHVMAMLRKSGRLLAHEGTPVTDPVRTAQLVSAAVERVLENWQGYWRDHGMI